MPSLSLGGWVGADCSGTNSLGPENTFVGMSCKNASCQASALWRQGRFRPIHPPTPWGRPGGGGPLLGGFWGLKWHFAKAPTQPDPTPREGDHPPLLPTKSPPEQKFSAPQPLLPGSLNSKKHLHPKKHLDFTRNCCFTGGNRWCSMQKGAGCGTEGLGWKVRLGSLSGGRRGAAPDRLRGRG